MTKEQAFEILQIFKTKANQPSHLYDCYHGETNPVVLWFIYSGDGGNSTSVASIRFENVFPDEQYIIDVVIGEKLYQLFDFNACSELVKSIRYKTVQ